MYSACNIPSGLSFGWSLQRKSLYISSKWGLLIPVIAPSFTAEMYVLVDTGDHKLALHVNSNLVMSIMIPNNLKNSLLSNSFFSLAFDLALVNKIVSVVCSFGNENIK